MAKKLNKGEENKLLNTQTSVLKVSIHCDGCQKKVRKLLSKIDGVYTTEIVADQGKVTVVGAVDSATLIKKLNKAGKHAVEWPTTKGGSQKNLTALPQHFQLDHPKEQQHKDNGKPQKVGNFGGGGDGGKGKDHKGAQPKQQEELQGKGLDGMAPNLPFSKEQKQVKFDLPSEDDDLDGDLDDELSDEYDEVDELDDSDVDDINDIIEDMKAIGVLSDKKGGLNVGGGNGKKGDQVPLANKNGVAGVSHDDKKGGVSGKAQSIQPNKGQGFQGMNPNQMGNMTPAVQGLPAGVGGTPAGYYNGGMAPQGMMPAAGSLNPYQQQQYMQAQQRMMMNGQGAYPMPTPMGYGYGYGQPAYSPNVQMNYSMFSDEDPNGYSTM